MIRLLSLASALLAATGAAALTCAPPDPIRSFLQAQESPDRYVILHGRLDFDPSLMPESGGPFPSDGPRPGAPDFLAPPVPARLTGFALGLDGFTRPVSAAVTLQPLCTGPWCGSIGPGGPWLLFARVLGGGYEVVVAPCGGGAFEAPSEAVLAQMAACLRGEACEG